MDSVRLPLTLTLLITAAAAPTRTSTLALHGALRVWVWTASGALADVNALLAGVTFNPAANFNGSFTIATIASESVATAITGSKPITGATVNDAPTPTNLNASESYSDDTHLNLTDTVV